MLIWQLFDVFFRVGLFSFGGGYTMIPLLQKELVELHRWLDLPQLVEMITVAEMTPGPVAINMATYVGYRQAGLAGSLAATLGVIAPSLVLVFLVTRFLSRFADNPWVQGALAGIRPLVVALVAVAALSVGRSALGDLPGYLILAGALLAVFLTRLHPAVLLLAAGGVGVILYGYW